MGTWPAAKRVSEPPCKEKKDFLVSKEGERAGLTLRSRPVPDTSIVKNSKVEENVGRL